jgi:DNA processing protein
LYIKNFEDLVNLKLILTIDGIGPQKLFSLLAKFHDLESIIHSDYPDLVQVEGISKTYANKICSLSLHLDNVKEKLEKEIKQLDKMGGEILTYWDERYPESLKDIYYPPLIIYVLGEITEDDKYSVAIVGTRQPSSYGKIQAENFSSQLAEKKITVVSGLARGIDSIAHESALRSKGRTIAVIGSGLNIIYPPENEKLFKKIKENGAIVTEFELGTKPDAPNFPRRNRIISGLSLGTLIIETKINGGAMQTAAHALDQGREVFAIPGNINSKQSEGANLLIQKGEAKLVQSADDILVELELKIKPEIGKNISQPDIELNLFEEKLLSILDTQPKQIDEIAILSSMSTSDCLVNLLTLEFKGLVRQLPGKMFIRC